MSGLLETFSPQGPAQPLAATLGCGDPDCLARAPPGDSGEKHPGTHSGLVTGALIGVWVGGWAHTKAEPPSESFS